jgi:hypothetical protein
VPEGRHRDRQAASSLSPELAAAAFGDEPGEAVNAPQLATAPGYDIAVALEELNDH